MGNTLLAYNKENTEQKNRSMSTVSPVLTGHWKLQPQLSTTQTQVLQLMGRKQWEISVIDKAEEDFNLFHFKRFGQEGHAMHFFEKHVVLYLDSKVLRVLSALVRLEVDRVKYHHRLVANNVEVTHPDDEKRFGECKSRTTWERHHDGHEGVTIRWFLRRGVLKVFHFLNSEGRLQVELEMTTFEGQKAKCIKIYERLPFTAEMQALLDKSPHKAQLLWPQS